MAQRDAGPGAGPGAAGRRLAGNHYAEVGGRLVWITAGERATLLLRMQGLTMPEIARRTYRSRDTIKNQAYTLRARLGVDTDLQAVAVCLKYGMIHLSECDPGR